MGVVVVVMDWLYREELVEVSTTDQFELSTGSSVLLPVLHTKS